MGRIHEGLPVTFTVDAQPGETFQGTVCQIRFNATSTQNVVTYTVVVETDNSAMRLPSLPDGQHSVPSREAARRAASPQRGLAMEAAAAEGRSRRAKIGWRAPQQKSKGDRGGRREGVARAIKATNRRPAGKKARSRPESR